MFNNGEKFTDQTSGRAYSKLIETMDLRKVGIRIRSARRDAGLTQEELGNRVGVSQSYIAKLENGETKNPGLNVIMDIAKEVGRSAAWMLYEHEELERLGEESIKLALMYEDMTEEQKDAMQTIAASFRPRRNNNDPSK